MKPLRVGVIGAGHLGTIHTRLLLQQEHIECWGVVDPDPAARQRIEQSLQVRTAAEYGPWLDTLDAAIIAAPSECHFSIAVEMLRRGIHLLIEKPLTTATWQADHLVEIASKSKAVVQVGHVERFNSVWSAIGDRLERPEFLEATRHSGYSFRSTDIGVVFDLMIHDLDLALALIGSEVSDVRASGMSILSRDEDIAHARVEFACGAVAVFSASRCSPTATRSFRCMGPHGLVAVDFANHTADVIDVSDAAADLRQSASALSTLDKQHLRDSMFTTILPRSTLTAQTGNALLDEQKDWLDAIRTGRQPRVDLLAGRRAVALAESIQQQIIQRSQGSQPTTLPFLMPPTIHRHAA